MPYEKAPSPEAFEASPGAFWAWLTLLRPPNLFTIPGDVLVGYALAGGISDGHFRRLPGLIGAALLLYAAGLLLNDWCDRDIDARERPSRPLPAGLVSPRAVLIVACVLAVFAIGLALTATAAAAVFAVVLLALIVAYNTVARRYAWLGVITMGACRGVNVLMGAAAAGLAGHFPSEFVVAAAVECAYIVVVAAIASDEAVRLPPRLAILCLPIFPIVLLVGGLRCLAGSGCIGVWVVWAFFATGTVVTTKRLLGNTDHNRTPAFVGTLIRNLIFMQAYWIAVAGGDCFWLAGTLILWPFGNLVSRWFYAS